MIRYFFAITIDATIISLFSLFSMMLLCLVERYAILLRAIILMSLISSLLLMIDADYALPLRFLLRHCFSFFFSLLIRCFSPSDATPLMPAPLPLMPCAPARYARRRRL